jgi:ribonuclease HI
MELMACALALEEACQLQLHQGRTRIIVRTDSMYIAENYHKAMFQWPSNKWLRRSGAPVLNADLWKRLTKAMQKVGIRVDYEWVRGHSKDEHNKAVDRMARKSAKSATKAPLSLVHVRRKESNESVQLGSVEISGQRMSIRIITTEYLDVQKVWKCKYEVITKHRDDYMMVDIIYSDELLAAGHSYYVKVNNEQDNPRVVKIYHEIEN